MKKVKLKLDCTNLDLGLPDLTLLGRENLGGVQAVPFRTELLAFQGIFQVLAVIKCKVIILVGFQASLFIN